MIIYCKYDKLENILKELHQINENAKKVKFT